MTGEVWADVANLAAIFTIYATAVNLLIGWAGIPAVVPTAFGAAGGYVAAWLASAHHVSTPLAALIALLVGGLIGFILSGPSLRLTIEYVILLTVAAATVIVGVIQNIAAFGGQAGLYVTHLSAFGVNLNSVKSFLPFTIVLAVLSYLLVRWLGGSMYGVVLKGLREDELAVRASGFGTTRAKMAAFTISAAMSGLAGAIYVFYSAVASPGAFGFNQGVLIVTMVIVGGLGRPLGPVIGAILVELVPRLLQHVGGLSATVSAQLQQVAFGAALIAVMLLRPAGILPELPSPIVRRYVKKAAKRGRLDANDLAKNVTATEVQADLAELAPTEVHTLDGVAGEGGQPMVLTARSLRKKFGGLVVADGFDFDLPAGQIVGLVGPNGAGKTTLFNLLTGAIRPDSGAVSLFGTDITGRQINKVVEQGMVRSFQDVRLSYGLTVLENVLLGAAEPKTTSLWRMIVAPGAVRREVSASLDRAIAALELVKLHTKPLELAGNLSFGEQKLVALARVIATDAQVLLLDEPAAGVGTEIARSILNLISDLGKQGRTILLVEHNLEVVRDVATSVYFLEAGTIRAHGSYEELTSNPELAASYFGTVATDAPPRPNSPDSSLPVGAKVND
jgi:branched-chain amino acid transport system permease protein